MGALNNYFPVQGKQERASAVTKHFSHPPSFLNLALGSEIRFPAGRYQDRPSKPHPSTIAYPVPEDGVKAIANPREMNVLNLTVGLIDSVLVKPLLRLSGNMVFWFALMISITVLTRVGVLFGFPTRAIVSGSWSH